MKEDRFTNNINQYLKLVFSFLRNIRKSLIESGSAQKYLLYALGEIALVVVGILIALQINNWNEAHKSKMFEINLLSELKETLIADYFKIDIVRQFNQRDLSSCQVILNHLDQNLPYHDSLMMHFRQSNNWSKLMLTKSAYDNAKSYGLHFIKADSTRTMLSQLYEYQMVWSETQDERQMHYYYQTVIPEITDLFEFTSAPSLYDKGVKPIDYNGLKTKKRYRNILKSNIENRHQENIWLHIIHSQMKELEELLQLEINSR